METKYEKKYDLSERYTLKDIQKSFPGNIKTVGTGYLIFPSVSSSLNCSYQALCSRQYPLHSMFLNVLSITLS